MKYRWPVLLLLSTIFLLLTTAVFAQDGDIFLPLVQSDTSSQPGQTPTMTPTPDGSVQLDRAALLRCTKALLALSGKIVPDG